MKTCPNCESGHCEIFTSLFHNDFFECLDCGMEWYTPTGDSESSVVDEILRDEEDGQI